MKTALITGSTSGIGLTIGLDLLDRNYFTIFNGRHNEYIPTKNSNYRFIRTDMSDINSVKNITSLLPQWSESLDVLILNAGMTDRTPFGNVGEENWDAVFNTNLKVSFFLIQALKDKINEDGRIIFISSISGIIPDSVSIAYGVSKAAINMMVPYLAKEFAHKRITVNAIAPGYTATPWHSSKSKEQIQRIRNKTLLNRFAKSDEISKAVMSLIDNPYITGQVLRVDGGFGL